MGHNPQTTAIDPALFAKNVTEGGVTFTKKPRVKLSGRFYVCGGSTDIFYESGARRARAEYQSADAAHEARANRRSSLVANFVTTPRPVSQAVDTFIAVGSEAAALSPVNIAATLEQAHCANSGMSATASAFAGALAAVTGSPSGVTSDDAPAAALASLSGLQVYAEKAAALRLRASAQALSAPIGWMRL